MSVFEKIHKDDLAYLLRQCRPYFPDFRGEEKLIDSSYEMIKLHKGEKEIFPSKENVVKTLEQVWYQSLEKGSPDYSVYGDPNYIADIWACWVCYSRNSVKVLNHPTSLKTKSVVSEIGDSGTIVDLGCGFGYTTLGLREIFPGSKIVGTNIETSYQFQVAKKITENHRIEILPDCFSLPNIDMIFASEYFEHWERPVEHLYEVVKKCRPKYFVLANGFNGTAIGHFNHYKHLDKVYPAKEMSKNFLKAMKFFGYQKMESKIWNSRPSVWKRP